MTELAVGIQGGAGSFHHETGLEYFGAGNVDRFVSFPDHDAMLSNLFDRYSDLHVAIIAVDNNTSGRVLSAVEALSKQTDVRVVGSITRRINQYLWVYPGHDPDDVEAVISQQPALDQCEQNIAAAGYTPEDYFDTAEAARRISTSKGKYKNYKSTGAIASQTAGELYGLTMVRKFNDNENNATKFWVISDSETNTEGTHSALTFEVPDIKGGLLRAVERIWQECGFNLTDIDSHLASALDGDRGFFAEITQDDPSVMRELLIKYLVADGYKPHVLGNYTPKGEDLEVIDENHQIPPALRHDKWAGRKGLIYPEGSTRLYVETNHKSGALYSVLGCLASCNLVDLGRPVNPKDNRFNRGFYIVLDPTTPSIIEKLATATIKAQGFHVEIVEDGEKVVA